ncbi:sulfite oxidase-like oxidoreductase [Elstera cyanobacteriorum]|uniref:Sulfite oxidase-like oxidoreductase n=1 Tax=Elstera cyanobacteriorum TaxID=2022747 RepID=A0A255XUF6_9PROT|nr:sulfite oxidase-like oxidoreductase [Elstera cyanobacteriorum]OYQ20563.1 sulfite oxidase-like oxidoreductase [Elstera cyanobacteriorum]GFZ99407.1 sulfite oxidase-like oxidoreductase [Elstera cyanobacteriorum]
MSKDDGLWGTIRTKLIDRKQEWAKEGRLLTGQRGDPLRQRLPPGQHEVKNWPVLDLGIQPRIAPEEWSLRIDGAVAQPQLWNWAQFQAQPQQKFLSDIHCVTAWSRFDNRWDGVSARHLLSVVQPLPTARHVLLHSADGYTTNLRLDHFGAKDVVLAHSWEGSPLTREHGGPVRLVVPKFYFWKSAKWLTRIEFLTKDAPGYWENRGYHNEGNPWQEDRYDR